MNEKVNYSVVGPLFQNKTTLWNLKFANIPPAARVPHVPTPLPNFRVPGNGTETTEIKIHIRVVMGALMRCAEPPTNIGRRATGSRGLQITWAKLRFG